MLWRLRSVALLAVLLVAVFVIVRAQTPTTPLSPARVAIVNAQKAVADTQEIKKDQAAMQAKYGPRQQQIASLQQQLQTIQNQLNAGNLAPQRVAELRSDGEQKQKQLQRMQEDLQADVNDDRQDILGKAGRQMSDVIKKIAEARGIDVVIDTSNTLYFKPGLDITAQATAEYDKLYPPR